MSEEVAWRITVSSPDSSLRQNGKRAPGVSSSARFYRSLRSRLNIGELAGGYPSNVTALGGPEDVVDLFDRCHELLCDLDTGIHLCF